MAKIKIFENHNYEVLETIVNNLLADKSVEVIDVKLNIDHGSSGQHKTFYAMVIYDSKNVKAEKVKKAKK